MFFVKVFFITKRRRGKMNVANSVFIDLMFILFLCSLYDRILKTEIAILAIGYIIAILSRGENGKPHL